MIKTLKIIFYFATMCLLLVFSTYIEMPKSGETLYILKILGTLIVLWTSFSFNFVMMMINLATLEDKEYK